MVISIDILTVKAVNPTGPLVKELQLLREGELTTTRDEPLIGYPIQSDQF